MKKNLGRVLVCPSCGGELECWTWKISGPEIEDGLLACECGETFPIIQSVPRMVLGDFRERLRQDYPSFYETYRERFSDSTAPRNFKQDQRNAVADTQKSFGYEWTKFSTMRPEWESNYWGYFAPKTADYFPGKFVLDAGCGMGRHLYYTAKYGAEVIGVDFSRAVDSAFQNTCQFSNAHLVQADLRNLPFRPETFDLIYSLGVLHHLPDPEFTFRSLVCYLKPCGEARIFVYWGGRDASPAKRVFLGTTRAMRLVTTRLPHNVLLALCYPIAIGIGLGLVFPNQILSRVRATRTLAEKLPMRQYANYPFEVLVNDQFDRFSAPLERRYTRGEVQDWLERAGLEDITVTPYYGWVGHGRKSNLKD